MLVTPSFHVSWGGSLQEQGGMSSQVRGDGGNGQLISLSVLLFPHLYKKSSGYNNTHITGLL